MTGATGFIGKHLVTKLKASGHQVFTLSRGDDPLSKVREAKPDVTYHLASLFLAENTYEQIQPLIESNLTLGTQLAEALAREDHKALVCAGTAWQNFEGKEGVSSCLYAATKEAYESILRYYADAFGLRACVLKLYDTYGPGDTRRKLLNILREATFKKEPVGLSPGEQKIDLLHIDDAVAAFIHASARVRETGVGRVEEFYLRSQRMVSIKELVSEVKRLTPLEASFGARPYRAREVMKPWDQGEVLPGWSPRVSLENGLKAYFTEGKSGV